ncbi:MAG: ABC transporter ATP-binding protein [Allosphingosinicella sp.]|uniref:ABC transporter ATP-binding protein n=1 Tax=Allosphingosinicella sp. TaxID=2823234 RepID=UPI003961AC50
MSLLTANSLSLPERLHDASLELRAGELVCLVGPNGSGKTSLLHAIAGIGHPAGRVLIDGADLRSASPERRPRLIGFLPASRDLKWPLAAADVVRLGGGSSEEVAAALAALDLKQLADRRVDRLSTGERSRVLLARVLAPSPRLLLLDEPVANLDPLWQLKLMDLLRARARAGAALLVAIHDLDAAARFADRMIVMDGGRIASDGAPAQLGPAVERVFGVRRGPEGWIEA